MKRGWCWSVFGIVLVLFSLGSCGREKAGDLSFLQKASFSLEVEGSLTAEDGSETAFSAVLAADRRSDAETYEITYLTPREMAGIRVTVTRKKDTGEEQITASLDGLSVSVSHNAVKGWLSPLEELLASAEETPERLRRTESGYRFEFSGDRCLTVDEKGRPLSLKTPKISFSVRKIQLPESSFSLFCTKQHPICHSSCNMHIDRRLFLW